MVKQNGKCIAVVAPHPDDETLGCGGMLLRAKAAGHKLVWIVGTAMTSEQGYSAEQMAKRKAELQKVKDAYGFDSVHELGFATTTLDHTPLSEVVSRLAAVFKKEEPNEVYLPFSGDVHSDHRVLFEAGASCAKWFRYPHVKRVLAYETLSETEFALDPSASKFQPNSFVDVSAHLARKLEILSIYASELKEFPFPRSVEAVKALAALRGATAGYKAAEAFMLLRELHE